MMVSAFPQHPRLRIAQWSELSRWDPKEATTLQWAAAHKRPLGDALVRHREALDRTTTDWHQLTLRFDGSMEVRRAGSKPVKGALFTAPAGCLVFSKIDVRNGAIGIIPAEWTTAAVSSEFPIYRIRPEVALPGYLTLLLRSVPFKRLLNSLVVGASGRQRIEAATLTALPVPLPPLATQQAILDADAAGRAQVAALLAEAVIMEKSIKSSFTDLFTPAQAIKIPKHYIASWSELSRWSVENVYRDKLAAAQTTVSSYPLRRLGDLIADLENGWSPKCIPSPASLDKWGVLKLGAVSFGTFNENQNKELPTTLHPKPALEVRAGDVLISRANVLRLVGASARVIETRPKLMLCDKIFRVVFRKESEIDPDFLAHILRTPYVREQIERAATGTSPTMKNISKPSLLNLQFPLPSFAVQAQLVAQSTGQDSDATQLRQRAASIATETMVRVEAMILGTVPG